MVVTPPAHEPITLDEAKRQLRIELDNTDEDDWLWEAIRSAREEAEDFTGRKLVTQTLDYTLADFPACDYINLPGGVLQSITSATYTDSENTATVWAASNYFALTTSEPGKLVRAYGVSWPSFTPKPYAGLVIRYVAGYGTGYDVPARMRHALLLDIDSAYRNRGNEIVGPGMVKVALSDNTMSILWRYKVNWGF